MPKEGKIMLIAPRPPAEREVEGCSWTDLKDQLSEPSKNGWIEYDPRLDEKPWGNGPFLSNEDVKNIEGCPAGLGCCECCHRPSCSRWCPNWVAFPRHATANQFFTPTMFTVDHREGYRACSECDTFLDVKKKAPEQNHPDVHN